MKLSKNGLENIRFQKKIIFITLFLILISTVAAGSLESQVGLMAAEVEGQVLEGPLGMLFGNQKINIYIELENEEQFIMGIVIKNKVVKSLQSGALAKPSLKIYVSEAVIAEIQTSNDPGMVLLDALNNEKITYQAVGLFNKIKFGTISVFVNLINNFNDEEEIVVADEKDEPETEDDNTEEDSDEPVVEDNEPEAEVDEVEDVVENEPEVTTHTVKMNNDGFSVVEITINAGETVTWTNTRTGSFKTAFVIGTQLCRDVKSGIFNNGESFSHTFKEPMTCIIVDGILTTKSMKVIVE